MTDTSTATGLTDTQRHIVEWGDGPAVVIAGAGSGKTRVIVERVRWLLQTRGGATEGPDGGLVPAKVRSDGTDAEPFAGPLLPEQLLVLTYNVKAAKELGQRLEEQVGAAARARLNVSNFHSFCHRVLTESATDAGLPAQPDVLDGIGQLLLLRDIRRDLPLLYYSGRGNPNYWLDQFVAFINRAKDELVTPDDFAAFADRERLAFEERFGSYERALERVKAQGNLDPLRPIRSAYAAFRREERAEEAGGDDAGAGLEAVEKVADREARRAVAGDGSARRRNQFDEADLPRIDELAETYVADGAALEVLRVSELAIVYRAYQEELAQRGALDFGEQISLVTRLLKQKPNVLRRYQRSFRYLLVDEFQDANIAQIELIELLGRTPDRPDNVMVVGDDDQSIYRFRGASFAAFIEFDRRFSGPPAHDPEAPGPGTPTRLRLEENFRSVEPVLAVANRLIERNELRYAPDKVLRPTRGPGEPVELVVATDAEDEARQVVDRIKARSGWDPVASDAEPPDWSRFAVLYRKHRHREAIVARLRDEGIPYSVVGGLSLFETPEIRDLEQSLRTIADPHQDVALVRMMSAAPWRLDALEILQIARMARYDHRHYIDVIHEIVESGELEVDRLAEDRDDGNGHVTANGDAHAPADGNGNGGGLALQPPPTDLAASAGDAHAAGRHRETRRTSVAPATRAKLRRLLDTLEDLAAKTWREGPFTVLEEYVNRTGLVLDLLAIDTLEAQRTIANIANFMRFARDWQSEHPRGTLAGFVDYLDAYQGAGGELPDQRGGQRRPRRRPADDALPGQGARVRPRLRAAAAQGRVAHPRVRLRPLPQGPAQGERAVRRHPHRGRAPPPLRGTHPRQGPARPHDHRGPGRHEGPFALPRRAAFGCGPGAAGDRWARGWGGRPTAVRPLPSADDTAGSEAALVTPRLLPAPTPRERRLALRIARERAASSCSRASIPTTLKPNRPGLTSRPRSPAWPRGQWRRRTRHGRIASTRSPCASSRSTARPAPTCSRSRRCRPRSATPRSAPTSAARCSTRCSVSTASPRAGGSAR